MFEKNMVMLYSKTLQFRKRYLSLNLIFLILFIQSYSQQYSRLSITPIFLEHSSGNFSFSRIADSVTVPDKYDYNYFGNNNLPVPFEMVSPASQLISRLNEQISALTKSSSSSGEIKRLREELAQAKIEAKKEDSLRLPKILDALSSNKVANKILSSILIDPKLGYMTTDVIAKRAEYNASDAEYMKAMNSELKMAAIRDKGIDLLKNVYFFVFDGNSYTTTSASKEDSRLLNVSVSANTYLFQINIDSLIKTGQFDELIFTSENPAKARAFQEFNFPIKQILQTTSVATTMNYRAEVEKVGKALLKMATSNGDATGAVKYIILSEEEIGKNLVNQLLSTAEFNASKQYAPFKIKVPVFSVQPIQAKIGKKESLGVDHLFKVTENTINKDGEVKERSIGWVRAKKVSDNRQIADGKMTPSTFYKVSSKKVEKGMKLTEKRELGLVFGVGYSLGKENQMAGVIINADFITGIAPGLRIGMGIGGFGSLRPNEVYVDNQQVSKEQLDFEGTNIYAEATVQKIIQANRLEFTPYLGMYINSIAMNKYFVNGTEYKLMDEPEGSTLKGMQYFTYGAMGGLKFGINLGKHTQLYAGYKLGFPVTSKLQNENGDEVTYDGIQPIDLKFNKPSALTLGVRLFGF